MKAGLFVCDHVMPDYQSEYGDYPEMYARLFPEFEWCLYDVCNGHFPVDLNECDFYMATGSKHSVYDDKDWILKLKNLIQDLYKKNKVFVGFCFGHQLIAEALGGRVGKSPNGWCVGVSNFEVEEQEKWMTPFLESLGLLMMCQDQILKLPSNAVVLASSPTCPYGIIKVGDHILGIQAHPEFSKDYDKMLMETRVDRMGEEVVLAGIESLHLKIYPDVIRKWVINFIKASILYN